MVVTKALCKDLDDNEIVRRSMDDLDYFTCLYERYKDRLKRYIRKISTAGEEEADDILQDSFIKIWKNLNAYDHSLKLSTWLYRIVHNETVSNSRKRKSFGKNEVISLDDSKVQELHTDLDLETVSVDIHKFTHEVLNRMPLKYRECIVLKYFEQMSYEDISDILRIPEGTVAIRINRAKKIFKNIAEKEHISFNP